jgi:hypothetical protein
MILFLPDDSCSLLLPFPTIKAANQQDLADGRGEEKRRRKEEKTDLKKPDLKPR